MSATTGSSTRSTTTNGSYSLRGSRTGERYTAVSENSYLAEGQAGGSGRLGHFARDDVEHVPVLRASDGRAVLVLLPELRDLES